jgi:hypothetical protein
MTFIVNRNRFQGQWKPVSTRRGRNKSLPQCRADSVRGPEGSGVAGSLTSKFCSPVWWKDSVAVTVTVTVIHIMACCAPRQEYRSTLLSGCMSLSTAVRGLLRSRRRTQSRPRGIIVFILATHPKGKWTTVMRVHPARQKHSLDSSMFDEAWDLAQACTR